MQAAVVYVDDHVLLGETRKLERCGYGIGLEIFMDVQSVEAGSDVFIQNGGQYAMENLIKAAAKFMRGIIGRNRA